MPQTRKETQPLTERIGVRVTAGEKARLREDATLASLSVSELVRRRYFGRPILARADQAAYSTGNWTPIPREAGRMK